MMMTGSAVLSLKHVATAIVVTGNTRVGLSRSLTHLHIPAAFRDKIDFSRVPKVHEADVVERVHRGSGPGGQAAAKTDYAVTLIHTPTKVTVRAEESRSQAQNRVLAKQKLITALDNFYNKELSVSAQVRRLEQMKEQRAAESRRRRREEKMLAKQAEKQVSDQVDGLTKEGEGLPEPDSDASPHTK